MIYVATLREIWTRIKLHAVPDGLLDGIKVQSNGEFRAEGEKDLPSLSMVDLGIQDGLGKSTGTVTIFLRSARRHGWVSLTPDDKPGIYDWVERVMDAIETSPSTLLTDTFLTLHKIEGTPILKDGNRVSLLSEQFTWDVRMSEITDVSFLVELDIRFTSASGRRGNRRISPVKNDDYRV